MTRTPRNLIPPITLWLLLAAPFPALGSDAEAGDATILAYVDDETITSRDVVDLLASQRRPDDSDALASVSPEGILQRLIQNRLLEMEGYRIGAHEDRGVKNLIWDLRRHRGMLALLDSVSADVPEPAVEEFDQVFSRENKMSRVAHILVDDDATARALLDSLSAGATFADLVTRHSRDSTSAGNGGDLGWAREDLYIPAFRNAIMTLEKNEVSEPVQSEKGWHLLRLTDTRIETVGQSDAMTRELRDAAMRERVMTKVRAYVESLKERYEVVMDQALVSTLDYGSPDPEVQAQLKADDRTIATLPWRVIDVRELTMRIRFENFHGLQGKADAADIRDRVFDDWVTELLLRHEASEQGFDQMPEILDAADALEREQVREQVVEQIVSFPFEPTADQMREYYQEHLDSFTPDPRLRANGVAFEDREAAEAFRVKLDAGAQLAWLSERTPEIHDSDPAIFAGWIVPEDLGLQSTGSTKGTIVGPFPRQGDWFVAVITAVEETQPIPFDSCRKNVHSAMRSIRMREAINEAAALLENAADIRIADGAHQTITLLIDDWQGTSTTPDRQ